MPVDFTPLLNFLTGLLGGNLLELGVTVFGLALVWYIFTEGISYLKNRK